MNSSEKTAAKKERTDIAANTRRLAEWATATGLEAIPARARRRAALILADNLAAMLAAAGEPEVKAIHAGLAAASGPAEATLFAETPCKLDRISAATGNGCAGDWLELDEGYRKAVCHAGLYAVPALIAEAEAAGLTLSDVLRSLVLSYEITTRVARTFRFKPVTLHPHGVFNSLGAAAAVALARGLKVDLLLKAITSSATLVSPAPYNHAVKGALVRNVWPGIGAANGFRAVDWAAHGIGGAPDSLYDVYHDIFGGEALPAVLVEDLGRQWGVEDGYHKVYGCCQYAHGAIEATLGLIEGNPRKAVVGVLVETHPLGMSLNNYAPATTLAGQFSMPHAVATAIVHRSAGPEAFSRAALAEPQVAALRQKVELRDHPQKLPWPNDRPSRVTLTFEDGTRATGEVMSARGGPDRPFSDAEVEAKIGRLTAAKFPRFLETFAPLLVGDEAILRTGWGEFIANAVRI
jgi:2-methylcitrate dehydratase PrpD